MTRPGIFGSDKSGFSPAKGAETWPRKPYHRRKHGHPFGKEGRPQNEQSQSPVQSNTRPKANAQRSVARRVLAGNLLRHVDDEFDTASPSPPGLNCAVACTSPLAVIG